MTETAPNPQSKVQDQKIMVLAIFRGKDGQLVIAPFDEEHDTDDLTPMTEDQLAERKLFDQTFCSVQGGMMKALGALYDIFSRRLYRNQFRFFENFCFAMYDTHRLNEVLKKKVRERVNELKVDVAAGL